MSELELDEDEHFFDFFSASVERLLCLLPCDLSLFFEVEPEEEDVLELAATEEEPLLPLPSTSSIELLCGCFCTCVVVAEELLPLEVELLVVPVMQLPVVPTLVLPGTEADFCNTVRASVVSAGTLRLLLSCCCCCWLPAGVAGFVLDTSGGGGGAGCTAGGGAAVFGNGG